MLNLFDSEGNEINTEDIVKHENKLTDNIYYYLCGKKMLYRYDENGMFNSDSFNNIKIDKGVTLVNDEVHIWTRMGTESDVYDEIFNK
jgi:hypothetical protein